MSNLHLGEGHSEIQGLRLCLVYVHFLRPYQQKIISVIHWQGAWLFFFFFNSLPSHYLLYDPFISPFPPSSFIQAWHCGFDNMVHLVSHSNSQLSTIMFLAFCVLHGKIGDKVISATESKTKTVWQIFPWLPLGGHNYLMNSWIQQREISSG